MDPEDGPRPRRHQTDEHLTDRQSGSDPGAVIEADTYGSARAPRFCRSCLRLTGPPDRTIALSVTQPRFVTTVRHHETAVISPFQR
jgi:hypothetical protein